MDAGHLQGLQHSGDRSGHARLETHRVAGGEAGMVATRLVG